MPEVDGQVTEPQETKPQVLAMEDLEKYQVPVKINGEEGMRSLKDVWAQFQKGEAAERRLQELHEKETTMQELIDAATFIKTGWEGQDGASLVKGLMKAGVPEADARRVVYGPQEDAGGGSPHTGGFDEEDEGDSAIASLQAQVKQLTEALSGMVGQTKQEQENRKILQDVAEALDKSPELAKIVSRAEKKNPGAKKDFLREAFEAVARRRQEFPTMGPRVIQAGLGDLLSKLNRLGISADDPTPPTSLGPSEISESGVHLSSHARALMDETTDDEDVSLFSTKAAGALLRETARNLKALAGK